MSAHQDGFGLVYPGSDIRRPPVVGMKFLHERAMRPRDLFTRGALRKPQEKDGGNRRHGKIWIIDGHKRRLMISERMTEILYDYNRVQNSVPIRNEAL